jgi:uncharacterized membrane protein YkvA (DUF1232 family)
LLIILGTCGSLHLLYILNPVEVVSEPIPVVGWADDVAVGLGAAAACERMTLNFTLISVHVLSLSS